MTAARPLMAGKPLAAARERKLAAAASGRAPPEPRSGFTWTAAQAGARALSPTSDPIKLLRGGLIASDCAVLVGTSLGAWLLRHGFTQMPLEIVSITLLSVALTVNAMHAVGAYGTYVRATAMVQFGQAVRAWSLVFAVMVMLAYVTKTSDDFSRLWALGWYCSALAGFGLARLQVARLVAAWAQRGKLARTVAIVDLSGGGDQLARRLAQRRGELQLVGVFTPERSHGRKNGVADLIALARLFRIDEVIVTVSGAPNADLQGAATDAVLRRLGTIPSNVRLCPSLPPIRAVPQEAAMMFGVPVLTVYHRPLAGWNRVAKRAEDLVIASLALVMLAPLLILVALLVRLDSPGPVLFRQRRLGFNNNVITIYKFRSMRHTPGPETTVKQAERNDPRFTRLGRFLRRSSIDELPQLLNVLRGEMSLVGPRPHALAHNDEYAALIDDYLGRHRVQPGITGWAQVNGLRGETDTLEKMQRRVEHDLAYIDRWSLLFDINIMFLTLFRGAFGQNAH